MFFTVFETFSYFIHPYTHVLLNIRHLADAAVRHLADTVVTYTHFFGGN